MRQSTLQELSNSKLKEELCNPCQLIKLVCLVLFCYKMDGRI
ncbi:hypothetical protein EMIT0P171_40241 [Pseudomonas sp. IT-P171]